MTQFYWMFSFIPDSVIAWILNIVVLFGLLCIIASYFITHIPFINVYRFPIQIVGIIVLIGGVYFKGQADANAVWHDKSAELQAKVVAAEILSKQKNVEIQTKIVTKIEHIKDVQVKTKIVIKEIAKRIDNECTIDPAAIRVLNSSATGIIPSLN